MSALAISRSSSGSGLNPTERRRLAGAIKTAVGSIAAAASDADKLAVISACVDHFVSRPSF